MLLLSMNSSAPSSSVPVVFFGTVLSVLSIVIWRYFQRSKTMRTFAESCGLDQLDDLPGDFPTEMLDDLFPTYFLLFGGWHRPTNVVGGRRGEDYLLAFDVTIGGSRNSYRRTIVSRRNAEAPRMVNIPAGLSYRGFGTWQMLTRSSRLWSLMKPQEIEHLWEELR